jgi:hypothetical protein
MLSEWCQTNASRPYATARAVLGSQHVAPEYSERVRYQLSVTNGEGFPTEAHLRVALREAESGSGTIVAPNANGGERQAAQTLHRQLAALDGGYRNATADDVLTQIAEARRRALLNELRKRASR